MQNVASPSVKPVLFVNFSDQPFSGVPYIWPLGQEETVVDEHCKWDGVPDTFASHESRYMEEWRAKHFAKHLINRELDKLNKPNNDTKLLSEMLKKCVLEAGKEVAQSNIGMELMNKNMGLSQPSSELPIVVESDEYKEYQEFLKFKAMKTAPVVEVKKTVKESKATKETQEFPDLKK